MGSGLRAEVKGFRGSSSHAFAGELQSVGVVDETIQDGVRHGGIADGLVPMLDRELAGDDGGAAAVTVLEDFQQIAPF